MTKRMAWLSLGLTALAVVFVPFSLTPDTVTPDTHVFRVESRQFAYSPSEFKVNPGDTVSIQLVSTDVVHGLYVDGYDISVEADPGQIETLTFIADKTGSFRFRCNVTCGPMHPFMIGKLTVGSNNWLYRSVGLAVLGVIGFFPLSSFLGQGKMKEHWLKSTEHYEPH